VEDFLATGLCVSFPGRRNNRGFAGAGFKDRKKGFIFHAGKAGGVGTNFSNPSLRA